eukprot:2388283-Rhodomonas_salina.2
MHDSRCRHRLSPSASPSVSHALTAISESDTACSCARKIRNVAVVGHSHSGKVSAYARHMRCPVQWCRHAWYRGTDMPGTVYRPSSVPTRTTRSPVLAYYMGLGHLRACYAKSGTDLGYGARSSRASLCTEPRP